MTHIFVDRDPQLEVGDSTFGAKDSLLKVFEPQPAGVTSGIESGHGSDSTSCSPQPTRLI